MPLVKKIIKLSPREVIVKWTGLGTETLTLASLVSDGQTLTGGVVSVNIASMSVVQVSTGACKITRNAEVALSTYGTYKLQQPNGVNGISLTENSSFDIVVDLVTEGTLILRLIKTQGYTGI